MNAVMTNHTAPQTAPKTPQPNSRLPTAFRTAHTPRNTSGSCRPPARGMSAKKPAGSVMTQRQLSAKPGVGAGCGEKGDSGELERWSDMGRPYSVAAFAGP